MLIIVIEGPLILQLASIRQILRIKDQYFILDEVLFLSPSHTIGIIMTTNLLFLHIVDNIHIHFIAHRVEINNSASSGDVAPPVRYQQDPQSIFVVNWQFVL